MPPPYTLHFFIGWKTGEGANPKADLCIKIGPRDMVVLGCREEEGPVAVDGATGGLEAAGADLAEGIFVRPRPYAAIVSGFAVPVFRCFDFGGSARHSARSRNAERISERVPTDRLAKASIASNAAISTA